jgi:hypothetical protein
VEVSPVENYRADEKRPISTTDEHKLASHQDWYIYRMVSASSHPVSPTNIFMEGARLTTSAGLCMSHPSSISQIWPISWRCKLMITMCPCPLTIISFRGTPAEPEMAFDETAKAIAMNGVRPSFNKLDIAELAEMLCGTYVSYGGFTSIHDEAFFGVCCKSSIIISTMLADE